MDRRLHAERLDGRVQRRHRMAWSDVPAGAFVAVGDVPALALDDRLLPWSSTGYAPRSTVPAGPTPLSSPRRRRSPSCGTATDRGSTHLRVRASGLRCAAVAGVLIHAVVYVAVNAFLVGVWVVIGGGSSDELQAVRDDPIQGMRDGFWPGYVMATWAVALVIHAGVRAAYALTGTGRRRRRRRRRLAAQRTDKPAPTTVQRGRRWVAVMFTDIAGSTELNEVLGDDAWIGVLDDHRRLVRGHVVAHDGVEIGTQGDGFLVRFDSPASAVDCAIAIQKELAGSRSSGTFTPDLRVGIHAGEATLSDADLVGRVINLAARVAGLAGPGEILVTEPVADHANAHVGFVDRGLQPLRGIAQPRHLLEVAWKDTTPPTPPPAPPPSPKSPSRDSSLVFGANSYVRWWRIPGALAPKDRQHRVAHTANSGSPR